MRLLLLILLFSTLGSCFIRQKPRRQCNNNGNCPSGQCVGGFCVEACTRSVRCPPNKYCDGAECKLNSNRHLPANQYVSPQKCKANHHCPTNDCVKGWCVRKCARPTPCPQGYYCDLIDCINNRNRHSFVEGFY